MYSLGVMHSREELSIISNHSDRVKRIDLVVVGESDRGLAPAPSLLPPLGIDGTPFEDKVRSHSIATSVALVSTSGFTTPSLRDNISIE